MGILDDAIREHLDLKRKHGARDAELREIEDEAFGAGDQPDPFVGGELYTEVGSAEAPSTELADAGNEEPTRLVESEAFRPTEPAEPEAFRPAEPAEPEATRPEEPAVPEVPSPPEPASEPEAFRPSEPAAEPTPQPELETSEEPTGAEQPTGTEPPSTIPGQVELPGQDEIPGQERLDDVPDAPAPSESLEDLIAEEEPFPEDSAAPTAPAEPESRPLEPEPDAQAPPEPEPAVPDPPPPPPDPGSEPPGRARGRVDVPTQEHPPPGETGDLPPLPGDEPELGRPDTSYEPPPLEEPPSDEELLSREEPPSQEEPLPQDDAFESDGPQLYDFETDEDPIAPSSQQSAVDDDFEALGPAEEEAPYLDEEEPYPEEPASGVESADEGRHEEPGTEVRPVLEDEEPFEGGNFDTEERRTLEPEKRSGDDEEEDLWFEKGPPKDFDFDD
jgi:hypothetical protein